MESSGIPVEGLIERENMVEIVDAVIRLLLKPTVVHQSKHNLPEILGPGHTQRAKTHGPSNPTFKGNLSNSPTKLLAGNVTIHLLGPPSSESHSECQGQSSIS